MSKKIDKLFEIKNKIVDGEPISVSEEELKCLIVLMDQLIYKYMKKISFLEKENSSLCDEIFNLTKSNYECYTCNVLKDDEKNNSICLSCVKNRVMYKER